MTKQKQVQQIKIDLDKDCISPRKEIVDAYEKNGATNTWTDKDIKPEYRANLRIHAASKGSGKPIVKKIFTLYRKRLANGTEWLIFHISLATKDTWGNTLSMPLLLGFYDLPQFNRTYSFDPYTKRTTSGPEDMGPTPSAAFIDGYETIYTYEWNSVKDQILQWRKDGTIIDSAKFLVWTDKKYSVPSFEIWFNLSVDDNIMLNMAGNRFDALYNNGDAVSLEKVKDIIRSELQKNVINQK
jgi:hypothetical protein